MIRWLFVLLALFACPAQAQDGSYRPGFAVTDSNPPPAKCVVWSGTAYVPCSMPTAGQRSSAQSQSITPASDSPPFPVNKAQIAGSPIATGSGASNAATQRVALSTDSYVHTADGAATRAGRGITISTGRATVAPGNVLCLYLENTGTSTYWLETRLFSHNLPDNVARPYSYAITNLTGTNLPPNNANVSNRNGAAVAPGLIARSGVSTTANRPGGTEGPGNHVHGQLMLGESFMRSLLPGARFANCMEGAATGLTGNADAQETITVTAFWE